MCFGPQGLGDIGKGISDTVLRISGQDPNKIPDVPTNDTATLETLLGLGTGGLALSGELPSVVGGIGSALNAASPYVSNTISGISSLLGGKGSTPMNALGSTGNSVVDSLLGLTGNLSYYNTLKDLSQRQQDINDRAYEQSERRYETGRGDVAGAESQLMNLADTENPVLRAIKQGMKTENLESQRQARKQTNLELANQGVRGGQAATLANRVTGAMDRGLQSDLNQVAYEDYLNRYNTKANYLANKARTGQAAAGTV